MVLQQTERRRSDDTCDRELPVRVKDLFRLCRPLRSVVLVYKECVDGVWVVCCVNFVEKTVKMQGGCRAQMFGWIFPSYVRY